MVVFLPLMFWVVGCTWINQQELAEHRDHDGDGFDAERYGGNDCNDDDAGINPEAQEIYYGLADIASSQTM